MGYIEILVIAYVVMTVIALTMTKMERVHSGITSKRSQALGFAACTFWPVMVMVLVIVKATGRV